MSTKIYKVTATNGALAPEHTYMVRAKSRAQAAAFIASQTVAASLPTQDELIEHASRAHPILDATVQAAEDSSHGE